MDKKNYQKPSMKAVELKMSHLICQSGPSTVREYRGGLDDSGDSGVIE
jgi:hypothetical protein